jgi:galactokinase
MTKGVPMQIDQGYVTTLRLDERYGVRILLSYYESIRDYMLEVVGRNDQITTKGLLDKCFEKFEHTFGENTGWYIYNVKIDLEARGVICQSLPLKVANKKNIPPGLNSISARMQNLELNTRQTSIMADAEVKRKFTELFERKPLVVFAPGRINLIGEHTDYNNGFVMPVAINRGVQFAINKSNNANSLIYSMKYKEYLSIDHSKVRKQDNGSWQNYLLGVLHRLQSKGHVIKPFNCVFEGDLPMGAGLSSSAAMECGFVVALNSLFNLSLPAMEMIEIAQWAEHNFAGVRCGIMDQFASVMGKKDHAILLDCRTLQSEYYPLQLEEYSILLLDTNVQHSLASSEYNARRLECEQGAQIIRQKYSGVKSLRDVTSEMLRECQADLSGVLLKRCSYVVEENERVQTASRDLAKGDLRNFGKKMFASHDGLSKLYEVSCAELDYLVEFAAGFEKIAGSRMMGGGFGGCTINLVHNAFLGEFVIKAKAAYKEKFRQKLSAYVVNSSSGATVIENP